MSRFAKRLISDIELQLAKIFYQNIDFLVREIRFLVSYNLTSHLCYLHTIAGNH